ncbi:MAG: hypothetical protein RL559_1184 [Pseudomonadota bacterium]|jgi:hypothetical protein
MSARTLSRTHRWLAGLLVCVLALAPFLHGHIGISHESGFHIDGLHAVQHPDHSPQASLQASDDESLALGVGTVRPPSEDGATLWWPLALLLVLPLLPRLPTGQALTPAPRWLARALYRVGSPPPSLAPPAA